MTTTPGRGAVERPPIDELSDIAWARVERRLWAELDAAPVARMAPPTRARRWPWLAAGALAAAAVVMILAWPAGSGSQRAASPSRVVTAGSATEVHFGDAEIAVAADSAVLLQGDADGGAAIVVERGGATFAVAPRAGRPPFVVLAGAVQVRVLGTRFTVTRSGDDARVDVAHGKVEVVARGHRELLLAGASWSSAGVREAASGGSITAANPDDAAATRLDPTGPPVPVVPGVPLAPAVTAPAPSAPAPAERAPVEPAPVEPAPVEPAQVEPSGADGGATLRKRFAAAQAIERRDPGAALRAYRELAAGDGPWAANALFAAARLASTSGDRALAVRFARAYLDRFPAGANAADAQRLLDRLAPR